LFRKINVLNVWSRSNFGVDPRRGDMLSFVAATKALKDDLIDVLVTAPINKQYIYQSEDLNSLVIQIIWIKKEGGSYAYGSG
jgi:hypothetical protein